MNFKHIFLTLTYSLFLCSLIAQDTENKYDTIEIIRLSGIVVGYSGDSISPLPFVDITIKNTFRGTTSSGNGHFNIFARKGDTLVFSYIGYKKSELPLPKNIKGEKYSVIEYMEQDTIDVSETIIYEFPSYQEFKRAFIDLDDKHEELDLRADPDLRGDEQTSNMNQRNSIQLQNAVLYESGQVPTTNYVNPLAWEKFIRNWGKGKYRNLNRD